MVTKDFGVTHARRHLKRHALPMDGLFSGDRRGVFGLVPRSQLISQIGRLTRRKAHLRQDLVIARPSGWDWAT
jgi:hypothetical protein